MSSANFRVAYKYYNEIIIFLLYFFIIFMKEHTEYKHTKTHTHTHRYTRIYT